MDPYLTATDFIQSDSPIIGQKARSLTQGLTSHEEKGRALFYFVRDEIEYRIIMGLPARDDMKAETTLSRQYGFCIPKAILLAALARSLGIPARLHFVDIRNHLVPQHIKEGMGTDLFVFHGFTEFMLDGQWIKANAAFHEGLCEEHGFIPVDFDGHRDALFAPHDKDGRLHMEYVGDRGTCADLPYDEMMQAFAQTYGGAYRRMVGD